MLNPMLIYTYALCKVIDLWYYKLYKSKSIPLEGRVSMKLQVFFPGLPTVHLLPLSMNLIIVKKIIAILKCYSKNKQVYRLQRRLVWRPDSHASNEWKRVCRFSWARKWNRDVIPNPLIMADCLVCGGVMFLHPIGSDYRK